MGISSATAQESGRFRGLAVVAGGIAAVAAGLCWVVKAVAILVTGRQPALLFELAPLLMALAVMGLAQQLPSGKPRRVSSTAATAALLAAVSVLANQVRPLPDVAYGIAMAGSSLLILVGIVAAGLTLRRRLNTHLPLALGLATLPALLAGGLLAQILGERALEWPLLVLGAAWIWLGVLLCQGRYRSE